MKRIFISHCTDDKPVADSFMRLLIKVGLQKDMIFYTGDPSMGIKAGEIWAQELINKIKECDIMLSLVTKNYFKSPISLFEYGAATGNGKKTSAFVFDGAEKDTVNASFGSFQYVDLTVENKVDRLTASLSDVCKSLSCNPDRNLSRYAEEFLADFEGLTLPNSRPPIGCGREQKSYIIPCEEQKIIRICTSRNEGVSTARIEEAEEINIIHTTSNAFVNSNKESIIKALKNGCDINMFLPLLPVIEIDGNSISPASEEKPYLDRLLKSKYLWKSPFLDDVNNVEPSRDEDNDIGGEIIMVRKALSECIKGAKAGFNQQDKIAGHIRLINCSTLLRSSIIVCRRGQAYYGWLTITLPPKKAKDTSSISLEFKDEFSETYRKSGEFVKENDSLMSDVMYHMDSIRKIAESRNEIIELI